LWKNGVPASITYIFIFYRSPLAGFPAFGRLTSNLATSHSPLFIILYTGARVLLKGLLRNFKGFYKCSHKLHLLLLILGFKGKKYGH
jgi:hypothetical protein